jgi:hypothetical protein
MRIQLVGKTRYKKDNSCNDNEVHGGIDVNFGTRNASMNQNWTQRLKITLRQIMANYSETQA